MTQSCKEFDFIAITLISISYQELCFKLKDLLIFSHRMTNEWISKENVLQLQNVIVNKQTNSAKIPRKIVVWPVENENKKSVFLCNYLDGCPTIINALKLPYDFIRIRMEQLVIMNFVYYQMISKEKNLHK